MQMGQSASNVATSTRLKGVVGPAYLFACLILGGSAQGIWGIMLLELAGIIMIAWVAIARFDQPVGRPAKYLLYLAVAAIALIAIQMIPMPAFVWDHGIRRRILSDYALLGWAPPLTPLSLTPDASFDALLKFIPPLALFCWIIRHKEYRAQWLAWSLLAGTLAGIVLGAAQVAGGENSRWYLYPETNIGLGVGFFANVNHMADLLVVTVPFVAGLIATSKGEAPQRHSAMILVSLAFVVLLLVGVALNRSLAAYGLALPACAASALLVLRRRSPWRRVAIIVAGASLILSIAVLAYSPIGASKFGQDAATSVQTRAQIMATSSRAIRDFMPFGSGLGSFVRVYHLYENPDSVTVEYVIHAHDDYAELALELGVPGLILILLFIGWWSRKVWRIWRRPGASSMARAASIASAVILVHSLVDYPLRTSAIAACFALCMAFIAEPESPVRRGEGDLWPTRHIVIA